jgi:tetratricopeptide (TPR) repeat protein
VLSASGRKAEAVDAWKRALQLEPGEFDALYNLTITLFELGRIDEARAHGERYVAEAPPAFFARDIDRVRALLDRSRKRRGKP